MMKESKIQIYPDALDRVPKEQREVVDREIEVAKLIGDLFELQERYGFYPEGLQAGELEAAAKSDPALLSPYKLVKWRRNNFLPYSKESLRAVDYLEEPAYREIMLKASQKMEDIIYYAQSEGLRQNRLIEASLTPQIQAMRCGTYEEAIFQHLNTLYLPKHELYTGLLDRYLDQLMGIKRSWSGWITDRDDYATAHYHEMVKAVLRDRGEQANQRRVIVGNALVQAGLPVRLGGYSGNTLPCEDYLRREVASESYIWPNVLCQKFEGIIKPNLMYYLPELTEAEKWELKAKKGATIYLVLHEGYGHSQVPFDERTEQYLKEDYPTLKELACDALTHEATLRLPKRFANAEMKKWAFAAWIAWGITDVEDYLAGIQQGEKPTRISYGQSGLILSHCYEREGCIEVNYDNGNIHIVDLDKLRGVATQLVHDLNQAILMEKFREGSVKQFIQLNSPTF